MTRKESLYLLFQQITDLIHDCPTTTMVFIERTIEKVIDEGQSEHRHNEILTLIKELEDLVETFNKNSSQCPKEQVMAANEALKLMKDNLKLFVPAKNFN